MVTRRTRCFSILIIFGWLLFAGIYSRLAPPDNLYQPAGVRQLGSPETAFAANPSLPRAKNVILFIGDGMGSEPRKAAQWQAAGLTGTLEMDSLPSRGWLETHSANNPITDSAAAATALATGIKTNNGVIGLDPALRQLPTILEQVQGQGLAVGLVTTTQISHATPAGFAAHVEHRSHMNQIAQQLLNNRVNVLLGGGEDEFLPALETGCFPEPGERLDGKNLLSQAVADGYYYTCDPAALANLNPESTDYLLGLFADEGLERPFSPTLAEMTRTAIEILSRNPEGFFLMVESGQIDWAAHANIASEVILDTLALNQAVKVALDFAQDRSDTLVMVTADHETGGMGVSLTSTSLPEEDGPFYMPDGTPFYVNWTTTGHTAADVPVTASGPLASNLAGTHDNTYLYKLILSLYCQPGFFCQFTDVLPLNWAHPYIESLAEAGVSSGYPDGSFRPGAAATRAETAVMLITGRGVVLPSPDGSHPFSDISGHWAEAYIEELHQQGLAGGYPDGSYRPDKLVSRAEMAIFLLNTLKVSPPLPDGSHPFSDITGHWAEAYLEELYDQGLAGGYPDGTYRPESPVTRAELAVFLVSALEIPLE